MFRKNIALVNLADNLAHKVGYDLKIEKPEVDVSYILSQLEMKVDDLHNFIKEMMSTITKMEAIWLTLIRSGTKKAPPIKPKLSALIRLEESSETKS
jgi:hypothetical protein